MQFLFRGIAKVIASAYFSSKNKYPRESRTHREKEEDAFCRGMLVYDVFSLSECKGISMRTGLSARRKIDKESGKGDSCTRGLVRVCVAVRTR